MMMEAYLLHMQQIPLHLKYVATTYDPTYSN
jgi:hypothetical protein